MKNNKNKTTQSAILAESMLISEDKTDAIKELMPGNVQRHIGDGRNGSKPNIDRGEKTECILGKNQWKIHYAYGCRGTLIKSFCKMHNSCIIQGLCFYLENNLNELSLCVLFFKYYVYNIKYSIFCAARVIFLKKRGY